MAPVTSAPPADVAEKAPKTKKPKAAPAADAPAADAPAADKPAKAPRAKKTAPAPAADAAPADKPADAALHKTAKAPKPKKAPAPAPAPAPEPEAEPAADDAPAEGGDKRIVRRVSRSVRALREVRKLQDGDIEVKIAKSPYVRCVRTLVSEIAKERGGAADKPLRIQATAVQALLTATEAYLDRQGYGLSLVMGTREGAMLQEVDVEALERYRRFFANEEMVAKPQQGRGEVV